MGVDEGVSTSPEHATLTGDGVDAIRVAEESLGQQHSTSAKVDLQVITAVLTAHSTSQEGVRKLRALQAEIEAAVRTRTDLDTPVGARDFQRFLTGKLRDIQHVLETADLDATSKATLLEALTALYAGTSVLAPEPSPATAPSSSAAMAPATAPVQAPTMPALPGVGMPASTGMPSLGAIPLPALPTASERSNLSRPTGVEQAPSDRKSQTETKPRERAPDGDDTTVVLPDEETVRAPNRDIAEVIRAVVDGTPVEDAYRRQGIEIPPVGTDVDDPVPATRLVAGDVAVFDSHHGLALGNGKALIENRVEPVSSVSGPSFRGWVHPPPRGATTEEPSAADTRPAIVGVA